jgi:disulfide bond formation protein DsbB
MSSDVTILPLPTERVVSLPRLSLLFSHVFVLAYTAVLAGGFAVQAIDADMPCPLCIIQRMAMMLCAFGPLTIIQRSRRGTVTIEDFAVGYGLAIVGAIAGGLFSSRQMMLHILPNDPGYGDPVLGLHLYTWAFITFVIAALCSGIVLILTPKVVPGDEKLGALSTVTVWLFGAVILANAVVVFFEEGLHWFLPDDPARYELLYQLGIR